MSLIGCCAVLEARALKVVYVNLNDAHEAAAQSFTSEIRKVLKDARNASDPTRTITPVPGIQPEDQEVFGTLCAALSKVVQTESGEHPAAQALALAAYRLLKRPAFIINAKHHEGAGITTEVLDVECNDPRQARSTIERRQEITMLKEFQGMASMLKNINSGGET